MCFFFVFLVDLDLASIMNNPMFQQMASSLGSFALALVLQPSDKSVLHSGGQGGGGLDFAAMMNNPAIQQMYQDSNSLLNLRRTYSLFPLFGIVSRSKHEYIRTYLGLPF